MLAYDQAGNKLGHFVRRINNEGVHISPHCIKVHDITERDLVTAAPFSLVGSVLVKWMHGLLNGGKAGVMVAHNGATDFQFLYASLIRAGLKLPPMIKHQLCTLQTLRRFSSLAYRKAVMLHQCYHLLHAKLLVLNNHGTNCVCCRQKRTGLSSLQWGIILCQSVHAQRLFFQSNPHHQRLKSHVESTMRLWRM